MAQRCEARQVTGRTLEEIEALAAEATPGPWGFFKHDCKELPSIDSFEITFRNKYGTAWIQSSNTHGVTMDRDMSHKEAAANAALLASAPDLLAIAQGQRERLAALDNAPRWSRHSERCGVAAALGVTTDRVDLDSVVYAVVKKLMDMRGGAAILSIELQEWMGKWPHQAASRR